MRPIVTDQIAWSVGRSVKLVRPTKMAEPIEMPFVLWAPTGPRNHMLDRVQILMGSGNFGGKGHPL